MRGLWFGVRGGGAGAAMARWRVGFGVRVVRCEEQRPLRDVCASTSVVSSSESCERSCGVCVQARGAYVPCVAACAYKRVGVCVCCVCSEGVTSDESDGA